MKKRCALSTDSASPRKDLILQGKIVENDRFHRTSATCRSV
jgi:hypothetical protein